MSRMLHIDSVQQQRDATEEKALHAQDRSHITGVNNCVKR